MNDFNTRTELERRCAPKRRSNYFMRRVIRSLEKHPTASGPQPYADYRDHGLHNRGFLPGGGPSIPQEQAPPVDLSKCKCRGASICQRQASEYVMTKITSARGFRGMVPACEGCARRERLNTAGERES